MKYILSLLSVVITNFYSAQFAIINDSDGFTNVRSSAQKNNNILDQLQNGFVVYYFKNDGNWANIDYTKKGKSRSGYVYKDRLLEVIEYKSVPFKMNKDGIAKLQSENIAIELKEESFNKKNHQLTFHKKYTSILTKIDDSKIFGTDGNIPKRQYQSISIVIKGQQIALPKTALKNLFEPTLDNSRANYDEVNDILYIYSSNSDGAGSYEVIWVIKKKQFKYRIEAYGF